MSLPDLTSSPRSDATDVFRLRDGFYATDLIAAALVYYDLFSRLAEKPMDLPTLCKEFAFVERPADVMLTFCTALGFTRRERGMFRVSTHGKEFLVSSSPWFVGPYYAALKDRPVCKDYAEILRTGRPANWGAAKDGKDWHKSMEDPAFADRFTEAMDCRGRILGPVIGRGREYQTCSRLLDVAGGSGIYTCCAVAAHAHLRATVLEKPPVDAVARRAIERRGLASRVDVVAGDMLRDAWPEGYDAHLLSNVLHDWDVPVVKQILAASHRALAAGGTIIIHDMHLNDEKTGPLPVAAYSALLMHATEGRCYSRAELKEWLEEAGFTEVVHSPAAADRSVITAKKK